MKGKIIIFVFALLFLVSTINADLGTYKKDSCVMIRVLSNCSGINLTEVSNDDQTFTINSPMTHLGGQTFNYSFCNTSLVDIYTYSWNDPCIDCSYGGCGNSFTITPTGTNLNNSESLIYIILTFSVFVLFLMCFYAAIKIPYSNKTNAIGKVIQVTKTKYVKLFFITLSYVSGVWFFNTLIGLSYNYLSLTLFYGFFSFLFNTLNRNAYIFIIVIMVICGAEFIRDIDLKKQIRDFGSALE